MVSSVDGDSIDLPPASQPAANRVKTYEKIIGLSKDRKSEVALQNVFKKLSSKTALILEDVLSDNRQLAEGSLQTLGLLLKDEDAVRSFSPIVMSSILSALCDVLLKTDDKAVAARALWCLAKQMFPQEVLVAHVHPIVAAIECALNHVGPSSAVAYESLDLLFELLQRLPKQMSAIVTRWSPIVFDHLTASTERVSERAAAVFRLGMPALHASRGEIAGNLVSTIKKSLSAGLSRNVKTHRTAVDAVQSCSGVVQLLGSKLHRTQIISLLLPCLEAAFRSGSTDVRVSAFAAWRSLCDNFAEDRNFLQEPKRINFIMQPFRARNAKVEAVVRAKFECWWHYVCLLREAALQQPQFENVVVPLLNFCLATELQGAGQPLSTLPNGSTTPMTPRSSRQVLPSTSPSPTIVMKADTPGGPECQAFGFLKALGAEVLANILGAGENATGLTERLPSSVRIADDVLVHNIAPITTAIRIILVESTDAKMSKRGAVLWSTLIDRIICALDSMLATADSTTTMFDTLRFIVLALSTADDRSMRCEICMDVVNDFLRIPFGRLTLPPSGPTSSGSDEPILIALADLVLMHLTTLINSSTDETRLGLLVDRIVALGTGSSTSIAVLDFCEKIVTVLDRQAVQTFRSQHQHAAGPVAWLALACRIIKYLMQGGDINQGTNVEYRFDCLYRLLLFPIKWFTWSAISESQCGVLLSRWEALCKGLSKEASLVVCAPPNSWCEDICHEILQHYTGNEDALTDEVGLRILASMVSCICDLLDSSVAVTISSTKNQRSKGKTLAGCGSLLKLLAKLLGILASKSFSLGLRGNSGAVAANQVEDCSEASATGSACATAMTAARRLLQRVHSSNVRDTAIALCNAVASAVGAYETYDCPLAMVFNQFETLWDDITNSLQLHHTGPYDAKLLASLQQLLIAALCQEKHDARRHALAFWSETFGPACRESELPAELKAALAKASEREKRVTSSGRDAGTPSTSQSDVESVGGGSQVELPRMPGLPSPQKYVGSFLCRPRASPSKQSPAKVLPMSPVRAAAAASTSGHATTASVATGRATASPSARKSSPAVSAKRGSPASAPRKDEFVFIAPSPHKKVVLTEHQKEKLKEKRILPTMYNGLEASQDTTCFMASQEDSASQCVPSAGAAVPSEDSVKVVESSIGLSDAAEFVDLISDAGVSDHYESAASREAKAPENPVIRCNQSIELVCSSQPSSDIVPQVSHEAAPPAEGAPLLSFHPSSPHRQRNPDTGSSTRSPVRRPLHGARGRRTPASTGKIGPGLLKWFAAIPNAGENSSGLAVAADSSGSALDEVTNDCDDPGKEAADCFPSLVPDDEQLAHPMDDDAKQKMSSASYIHVRRERRPSSGSGEFPSQGIRSLSGRLPAIEHNDTAVPGSFASSLKLHGEISRPTDNCGSPSAEEIEQIVLEKSFESEQVFPASQGAVTDFGGILSAASHASSPPALQNKQTAASPGTRNSASLDASLPLISDQALTPDDTIRPVADPDPADCATADPCILTGGDSNNGSCCFTDDGALVAVVNTASVRQTADLKRKRRYREEVESSSARPVTRRKSGGLADLTGTSQESASSPSYEGQPSPKRLRRLTAKGSAAPSDDSPVATGNSSRRRGRPPMHANKNDGSDHPAETSAKSADILPTTGVPLPTEKTVIRKRGRPPKPKSVSLTAEGSEKSSINFEEASMQPSVVIDRIDASDASSNLQVETQAKSSSLDPVYLADTVPDASAPFVAECQPSASLSSDGIVLTATEVNMTAALEPIDVDVDPSGLPLADDGEFESDRRQSSAEHQCSSSSAVEVVGDTAAVQVGDLKPSSEPAVPLCSSPRSVASGRTISASASGRNFGRVSARLGGSLKCSGMSRSAEILRRSLDLSAAAAAASNTVASVTIEAESPQVASTVGVNVTTAAAVTRLVGSGNVSTVVAAGSSKGLTSSPLRSAPGGAGLSTTAPYAYSPSASPSGSILKRRSIIIGANEGGQSPSPSTKSRRVSFAATVEVSCNNQNQRDSHALSSESGTVQASILETEARTEHTVVHDGLFDIDTSQQAASAPASSSIDEQATLSSAVYQSTPESQLDCHLPFFPDLVGCSVPVDVLTPHLTSSVWSAGLTNLLKARAIHSVGDLASLTAYDIHNLPIRAPKLATVKKALHGVLQEFAPIVATKKGGVQCSSKAEILATDARSHQSVETTDANVIVPSPELNVDASIRPQPMDVEAACEVDKTSTDCATVSGSTLETATQQESCGEAADEAACNPEPVNAEKLPEEPPAPTAADEDASRQQPCALEANVKPARTTDVFSEGNAATAAGTIRVKHAVDSEGASDCIDLTDVDSDVVRHQPSDSDCPQLHQGDRPASFGGGLGVAGGGESRTALLPTKELPAPEATTAVCDSISLSGEAARADAGKKIPDATVCSEANCSTSKRPSGLVDKLLSAKIAFSEELRQLPTSDLFSAHAVLSELTAEVITELKGRCFASSFP